MLKVTALTLLAGAAAHTRSTYDAAEFATIGRANPSELMTFTAALPARNTDKLEKKLMEISNPQHPSYTQWLTQKEVVAMTAPDAAIREEVYNWFTSLGAACVHWPTSLRCQAPVRVVEQAFATEVTTFKQVHNGRVLHRVHPDASFTMPAHLDSKLLFVTAVTDFPTKRMRLGSGPRAAPNDPSFVVAPETLDAIYHYSQVKGAAASTQGPAEFQNDDAITAADQTAFSTNMAVPMWNISVKHGPFQGSDIEATLDAQYIYTIGQANTQYYWTEADWMYEWTEALKTATQFAAVYSVSWGWSEQDQCRVDGTGPCQGGTSQAYVVQTNAGFMAAGALGISILVSSGDSGAHGRTDPTCTKTATSPDWPAASPYILSIGATQLQNGGTALANAQSPYCKNPTAGTCAGGGVEIVCSPSTGALIASGGGFSVYTPQPAYQAAAVAGYLATPGVLTPGAGNFNTTTRGYPDVSALGHNVVIYYGGRPLPVDGTSCSAPIFGGVIGLANAARLGAGKKVLGFVNQAIYQVAVSTPAAFIDVTSGDNRCTEEGCQARCTGFGAVKGWDAATGFGSPNIPVLVAALAAL